MHSYVGTGYLWNLLRRGASPVANSRRQIAPLPVRSEATFATPDNGPFEVQSECLDLSPATSAIAKAPTPFPLDESPGIDAPATSTMTLPSASDEALDVPSTTNATSIPTASAASEKQQGTLTLHPPAKPSEPLLHPTPEASVSLSTQAAEYFGPSNSLALNENPSEAYPANEIFELKMPENFFGQPVNASNAIQSGTGPATPDVTLAPATVARMESEPARGFISPVEPSRPATVDSENLSQPKTTRIPSEGPGETETATYRSEGIIEPQRTTQLVQKPQISEARATPQPGSVASDVADELKKDELPALRFPAPAFEGSAPVPRKDQTAEHLMLRQPPIIQTAMTPPARLRINRLDINIINTVPTPQPTQTRAPDVSQLLEREHLGRLEFLL